MLSLVYNEFQSHIWHPTDILMQLVVFSLVRPLGLANDVAVIVDSLLYFVWTSML